MVKINRSLTNGQATIEISNDDQKQPVTIQRVVISGPRNGSGPILPGFPRTLMPKGVQLDHVTVDITGTIQQQFKQQLKGDGQGEILIDLDLDPKPDAQISCTATIKNGQIVAFT